MPLPKAVQEIGDAAEASAVALGIKPGSPPLDEHGNPAAPVTSAQPAATVTSIDPDDRYSKLEERFKKYKAQNDQVVFDLRQENSGLRQSVDSLSAETQELKAAQSAAPVTPAVVPAADLESGFKAYYENLPKSIKDEYTEAYLKDMYIIQQTAVPASPVAQPVVDPKLEARVAHVEKVQEKTRAQLYEEAMDDAFPGDAWITMTTDGSENWNDFCRQTVSPIDNRNYGGIIEQGNANHDAQTVTWVLKQYQQYLSELNGSTGKVPASPLESQLTPEGGGGGGGDPIQEINAQAETFKVSQVTQFYIDVATGNKYTPEQAADIEKQILAAQSAGKIIEG